MPSKKTRPLPILGAHMSISGGLHKAIERGDSIGCTAIQLFTKSNRQWRAKQLTENDIELFNQARNNATHVQSITAHASYLINIGSPNLEIAEKSTHALTIELERCAVLQIPNLVIHPGSHSNTDVEECLKRIAKNLNTVFDKVSGKTNILLETMAGQGSNVCHTFEHIATTRDQVKQKQRVGVCVDTCHLFAAGYKFDTEKEYTSMWEHFDTTIGLKNLKVLHMNDSLKSHGSRVDRHEHIGKGKIKIEAFKLLMNDSRFLDIPKILETPKETLEDDAKNIQKLIKLIDNQ